MKNLLALFLFFVIPVLAWAAPGQPSSQGTVVDHQEMEQVLNDFLAAQSHQLPQVELRFNELDLPDPFQVPQGRIDHQIIPSSPGVIGSHRMTLLTRVDGEIVSNLSIRVDLEAMAEVVVSAASMRRGSLLKERDVELRYQDISRLDEPIFSLADVVGKQLKRSVRLGEPLELSQVEFPPVVKRGERVVIKVESRGLLLSAAGEAKQDGRPGEDIRVMNTNSRKEIICRVVSPGLVKVEF